jgi:hypothetical protein
MTVPGLELLVVLWTMSHVLCCIVRCVFYVEPDNSGPMISPPSALLEVEHRTIFHMNKWKMGSIAV